MIVGNVIGEMFIIVTFKPFNMTQCKRTHTHTQNQIQDSKKNTFKFGIL